MKRVSRSSVDFIINWRDIKYYNWEASDLKEQVFLERINVWLALSSRKVLIPPLELRGLWGMNSYENSFIR